MRIAFLNPWANASENHAFRSQEIAARRIGHELLHCANSDDLAAAAPDFVLAVSSTQPKLTAFPTYGVIHEPRDRFLGNKEYFQNLLTYDGYVTISDSLVTFLTNLLHGVRRPANIGVYYQTCQENTADPEFLSKLKSGDVKLTYFGTNWDRRRSRFFQLLSDLNGVEIYGPERSWQAINPKAYKGVVPFDGVSVQAKYRENGIGLVLLSDSHLADDVISNRIFEIASVGAVVVACRIPWLERNFGDSVYYFDQNVGARQLLAQLNEILEDIKAHPVDAFNRAQAAQRVFRERFSAEKLLQNAVEYHRSMAPWVSPGAGFSSQTGSTTSLISVVVRCGGRPAEVLRRAVKCVADQTVGRYELILVRYKPIALDAIVSEFSRSIESILVVDCFGGTRSNTLWCGLRQAKGKYFAILDDDDMLMPNHFQGLYPMAEGPTTENYFGYTGFIQVRLQPGSAVPEGNRSPESMRERRFVAGFGISQCEGFFDQSHFFAPNSFLASTALLDHHLLADPQMATAEDSYLILSLLSKTQAQFNYRATAVHHEAEDGSGFASSPNRANDVLNGCLRLLPYSRQPPQIADAQDRLLERYKLVQREQYEHGASSMRYDVQAQGDTMVYHAGDFELSWTERQFLESVPFRLETRDLIAGGVQAADCRLLDAGRVAMSITPPPTPWHFAVQIKLRFDPHPDTAYLVEVDCSVTKGTIGFGVANKEDDFLYRVAVPSSARRVIVHLPFEDARAVDKIVVQNWESGGEAHVDIRSVTLWEG